MYVLKYNISAKITFLLLAATLSSCRALGLGGEPTPTPIQDPDLIDHTLITGEPCLPPCWQGMYVGETGKKEAIQIISNLSFIEGNSLREGESSIFFPTEFEETPAYVLVFDCKQPKNKRCLQAFFVDDRLKLLEILPNYTITIGEVSVLLGEPDLLGIHPGGRLGEPLCRNMVVWRNYQLEIEFSENRDYSRRDLCRIITNNDDKLPKDIPAVFVRFIPEEEVITPRSWYGPWTGFIEP